MTSDLMERIRSQAKEILAAYKDQRGRTKLVRNLDECLMNEQLKIRELRSFYSDALKKVKFLRPSYFFDHDRFMRFQEIDQRYFTGNPPPEFYFVSHRWKAATNPDPSRFDYGCVAERVMGIPDHLHNEIGVWYDFSCVPQIGESDRLTTAQSQEFSAAIAVMHLLPALSMTISIIDPEYLDRTWCLAEWIFSGRISPVAVDARSIPFGNAIKFRQLALVLLLAAAGNDVRKMTADGKDSVIIAFLNSLLLKTFASSQTSVPSDKALIFEVMHRYLLYHLRFLGIRSQLMIGYLTLDRYDDAVVESLIRQFLFITEDADLSWVREALLHMDTMVLDQPDPFDEMVFHKMPIGVASNTRLSEDND